MPHVARLRVCSTVLAPGFPLLNSPRSTDPSSPKEGNGGLDRALKAHSFLGDGSSAVLSRRTGLQIVRSIDGVKLR